MTIAIPNEVSNRKAYAGIESVVGTAVTPTFRLLGQYTANEESALNRTEETTGGFDRFLTPKRQRSTFSGTYTENLTYESLAMLSRVMLKSGSTGVSDAETIPGYTYDKAPEFDAYDVDSMTVQHYVDGLGFENTGVMFSDWTISGDADSTEGAWTFSSNLYLRSNEALPGAFDGVATGATGTTLTMTAAGWTINAFAGAYIFEDFGSHQGQVRKIVSNTADTVTIDEAWDTNPTAGNIFRIEGQFPAGIAIPQYTTIEQYGTLLTLAPSYADLATAEPILGRIISWNVTCTHPLFAKAFIDNPINEYSSKFGKGARIVSGAVRFEFDRRDEWIEWRQTKQLALNIAQTGPEIDATAGTTFEAGITVPRAYWDTYSPDEREQNLTATFNFLSYKHATEPIIEVLSKNTLATLP